MATEAVILSGTASVSGEASARLPFPSLPVFISSLSAISFGESERTPFPRLPVFISALAAFDKSYVPGIINISKYDEMAYVFRAAINQQMIISEPYKESASRVIDVNSSLAIQEDPLAEKPVVVKGWLI